MIFLYFFFSPSCALCSKYINILYIFCLICITILTICEQILLITLYLYQAPCSLIEHSIHNGWLQSGFFSNILLFVQMHDSNFIIYFTAIIFCFCFLRLFSTCSKITYLVNYSIFSQPIILNNLFRFTFSLVLQINICFFMVL